MPPPHKRPSDEPHEAAKAEKKLVQTKLNFARAPPRPTAAAGASSSSSSSPSSSGTSSPHFANSGSISIPRGILTGGTRGPDGLYRHTQWLRLDPSEEERRRLRNHRGGADDGLRPGARVLNRPRRGATRLAAVAAETVRLIPGILARYPLPGPSVLYTGPGSPPALDQTTCPAFVLPASDPELPGFPGTRIRVVDDDSFDVAISLGQSLGDPLPVLVLNLANANTPGGGWLGGAMAQEEELCFRSTLSATLTPSFFPLPVVSAIYSPEVIVFRSTVVKDHAILERRDYKRVSVLSMAAERGPALDDSTDPPTYARQADRDLMRRKIELMLRVAAHTGHRRLVLGALGCGVFGNPSEQVAEIFREVFAQNEFNGGWWSDVVFAVLDTETVTGRWGRWGDGPYGAFWKNLDGFPV